MSYCWHPEIALRYALRDTDWYVWEEENMPWKTCLLCALFLTAVSFAQASDDLSARELYYTEKPTADTLPPVSNAGSPVGKLSGHENGTRQSADARPPVKRKVGLNNSLRQST